MRTIRAGPLICFLAAGGAACQETRILTAPDGLTVSITLASSTGSLSLRVGDTLTFAVSTNLRGSFTTTWHSKHPDIVSVDATGVVRGVAPGQGVVVARLNFRDGRYQTGGAELTVLP